MLRATSIKKSNRHKGRREVGGGNCHRSNTAVAVDTIRAGTEANAVAALVIHMLTAIRRGRPISVLSMFRNFMHRAGRGRTVVKRTREGSAHPECEQQAVEAKLFEALHRDRNRALFQRSPILVRISRRTLFRRYDSLTLNPERTQAGSKHNLHSPWLQLSYSAELIEYMPNQPHTFIKLAI